MIRFDGLNILMSNGEHVPDWALYSAGAIIAIVISAALTFGVEWINARRFARRLRRETWEDR